MFCCPNCFQDIKDGSLKKTIICPNCRKNYSKTELEYLRESALESVYYGWMFERAHDEQIKKHDITVICYHLPQPSEILIFLGMMWISSIISGLSYAAFIRLIRKIKGHPELKKEIEKMTDNELKEFFEYIKSYYKSRKRVKKIENKIKSKIRKYRP